MVKKRKKVTWSPERRAKFMDTMAKREEDLLATARKETIRQHAETLKEEREVRKVGGGIDVSTWRNEQRPRHIYIQEAGRLRRYELRSLEVYIPEGVLL